MSQSFGRFAFQIATLLVATLTADACEGLKVQGNEIVAELSYEGGARRPSLPVPYLTITAEGQVRVYGMGKPAEAVLNPGRVQEIVALATKTGFFEVESTVLESRVRESIFRTQGSRPKFNDASTTILSVRREDKLHTVRFYAARQYLSRVPNDPVLKGFVRLAEELESIAATAR